MGEGPIIEHGNKKVTPRTLRGHRRTGGRQARSAGRRRQAGIDARDGTPSRRARPGGGWYRHDASAEALGSEEASHLTGKAAPEHVAKGPGKAREGIPRSGQRPPAPPQPTSPRHPTFVVYFAMGR